MKERIRGAPDGAIVAFWLKVHAISSLARPFHSTFSQLSNIAALAFSIYHNRIRLETRLLSNQFRRPWLPLYTALAWIGNSVRSVGIHLRKYEPAFFVREDPYQLFEEEEEEEEDGNGTYASPETSVYLLTRLLGCGHANQVISIVQQHIIQIQLPPGITIFSAWPVDS